jgi:bifunctional non-homologous end joining protein LigD
MRKTNVVRLLRGRPNGIFVTRLSRARSGPIYSQSLRLRTGGPGVERLDRRYRGGKSPDWIKVKNPASPATHRAKEAFNWSGPQSRLAGHQNKVQPS